MAIQYSASVRNARINAIETTIGTAPQLRLYSGAQPANCAAAATGTLLATLTLPTDWAGAASGGSSTIAGGPWSGTGAAGAGAGTNIGHYRLYDSAGTTCHEQGSVTATGGGGDLTFDNINVANGQAISVSTWTRTDGNA